MDKATLVRDYSAFLTEQGYKPKLNEFGDVVFKKEGIVHIILVDESDPTYFRLGIPNFWGIRDAAERNRALAACDEVNFSCKAAKFYTLKGTNVWAFIEMFLADPKCYQPVFERLLSALQYGTKLFVATMRPELAPVAAVEAGTEAPPPDVQAEAPPTIVAAETAQKR